jgi:glycosyltransferase involved in cell wall biosynthesis
MVDLTGTGTRMRIDYVVLDASARGGIARSTFTMAGALADLGHDVGVVGLVPGSRTPALPSPDNVRVSTLLVRRPGLGHAGWSPPVVATFLRSAPDRRLPSSLARHHDDLADQYSRATDRALARYLLDTDADVVLGTRPGINIGLARLPHRKGLRVVALEHVGLHRANAQTRAEYERTYSSLDAVVTLTPKDGRRYRELLGAAPRVHSIPNAIAASTPPSSGRGSETRSVVAAGGRLVRQKGFDLLLEAWAQVVERNPTWLLRIYGDGPLEAELTARAAAPDLAGRVQMMGFTPDLPRVLHLAEVFVLSSRFEGMPMVLLEAMAAGNAVVAFDCPTGPRQLITHEQNGLLVPPGSVDDLAAALQRVLADHALRRDLGHNARRRARHFDPAALARRWDRLLRDLTTTAS